jgi:hypothetical protein
MKKDMIQKLVKNYPGQKVMITYIDRDMSPVSSGGHSPVLRREDLRGIQMTEEGIVLPKKDEEFNIYRGREDEGIGMQFAAQYFGNSNLRYWLGENFIPNTQIVEVVTSDGKVWGRSRKARKSIDYVEKMPQTPTNWLAPREELEDSLWLVMQPNSRELAEKEYLKAKSNSSTD